jgi:hypothetical protein
MVSPEHFDNMPAEEPALPPTEKKQPKSTSLRWWVSIVMYIIVMYLGGVVFPLVGGFLLGWLGLGGACFENALIALLFAFIGALLLRSWWALLIVPVADLVGWFVGGLVVPPFLQGGWPAVQAEVANYFSGFQYAVELRQEVTVDAHYLCR